MTYKIKYRRKFLWKTEVISGHTYIAQFDKLIIFYPNGTQREIPEWSKCETFLDTDWVLAKKTDLEKQAGQAIPLNVAK